MPPPMRVTAWYRPETASRRSLSGQNHSRKSRVLSLRPLCERWLDVALVKRSRGKTGAQCKAGLSRRKDLMQFRVSGAERDTGKESTWEWDCESVSEARQRANAAGYLVSDVTP